ncbi:MAG: Asp-tRNA(Asn)/Glu-tRNA(Gln) amidotransferase subunit GatC [Acidimicrobiales bacterium]
MSELTRDDVAKVARLARLHLTEEELDRFTGQLAQVLDHANDLRALDLTGVAPTAHPVDLGTVVRPDEVRPGLARDAFLGAAPQSEDGRFAVPRILGEEP